jgi:LAO/AO transport system kinase
VSTCSSITHEGIPEVWNMISQFLEVTQNNGFFHKNRKEQNQYWLLETINEQLKTNFYSNPKIQELLEEPIKKQLKKMKFHHLQLLKLLENVNL